MKRVYHDDVTLYNRSPDSTMEAIEEALQDYYWRFRVPGGLDFQQVGFFCVPTVLNAWNVKVLRAICMRDVKGQLLPSGEAATLPVAAKDFEQIIRYGARLLEILKFPDVRYASGAIIPRYPQEPRRCWHVDWWAWHTHETHRVVAPQVGLIFYLDTTFWQHIPTRNSEWQQQHETRTGALLVLQTQQATGKRVFHTEEQRALAGTREEKDREIVVPCNAGDVIVLDARLMHSVEESVVPEIRIALTLWYMVNWKELSPDVKKTTMQSVTPDMPALLGGLCPDHDGSGTILRHIKIPV